MAIGCGGMSGVRSGPSCCVVMAVVAGVALVVAVRPAVYDTAATVVIVPVGAAVPAAVRVAVGIVAAATVSGVVALVGSVVVVVVCGTPVVVAAACVVACVAAGVVVGCAGGAGLCVGGVRVGARARRAAAWQRRRLCPRGSCQAASLCGNVVLGAQVGWRELVRGCVRRRCWRAGHQMETSAGPWAWRTWLKCFGDNS